MPMSISSLQSKIIAQLQANLTDYFNPSDDHRLGYDYNYYFQRFALAIATAVYDEITTNARAVGTDSPHGDSHNLNII